MNTNFVLTIGRQLGSGGHRIGELVAERLGVKLYDRQLIDLAAAESGLAAECFERADERESHGFVATLLCYLRSPLTAPTPAENPLSGDALFQIQSDVIRRVAERESCIFVGRCADYVLRDHPRKVDIFITADEEARIARIIERTGVSAEEARRRMAAGDAARRDFYNFYSLKRWGAAASYDLSVNSSRLGDEATAELILRFACVRLNLQNLPK